VNDFGVKATDLDPQHIFSYDQCNVMAPWATSPWGPCATWRTWCRDPWRTWRSPPSRCSQPPQPPHSHHLAPTWLALACPVMTAERRVGRCGVVVEHVPPAGRQHVAVPRTALEGVRRHSRRVSVHRVAGGERYPTSNDVCTLAAAHSPAAGLEPRQDLPGHARPARHGACLNYSPSMACGGIVHPSA